MCFPLKRVLQQVKSKKPVNLLGNGPRPNPLGAEVMFCDLSCVAVSVLTLNTVCIGTTPDAASDQLPPSAPWCIALCAPPEHEPQPHGGATGEKRFHEPASQILSRLLSSSTLPFPLPHQVLLASLPHSNCIYSPYPLFSQYVRSQWQLEHGRSGFLPTNWRQLLASPRVTLPPLHPDPSATSESSGSWGRLLSYIVLF